ncbi:SDR family NAD(P)-dependent oxidoreductase [Roseibium litorale]|uniref:SDR family NAD(P)-dependent oxidoreductase n=1 Tax=Roseibium litorale TaxID=2803841 RepID=A0ABR9CGW8_9HYPH|nr:SDR family NAD(P)-dependent oxidoreductase [Roseibium litorale]MBD8890117.1 SDR family NAD(P)-dependent oxidoreductase [Roseibium litorale]
MNVFVTGGTGTIGRALVQHLLERGHHVIGLTRSPESASELRRLGPGFSAFPGDLAEPKGWTERAIACDAVIHTAATFTPDMSVIDRRAMQAVKMAARTRKHPLRVIYTGGIWLYPPTDKRPLTETVSFEPQPAFIWMKEQIRSLQTSPNLSVAIIHPALVCTPHKGPVAEIVKAVQRGQPFRTRADAETIWPLVSAQDLAKLYGTVLEARSFRLALLAAAIPGVRVKDLGHRIATRLGGTFELETIRPKPGTDPKTDFESGYALSQVVSSRRATSLASWNPSARAVDDLIDEVIETGLDHPSQSASIKSA